MTEQSPSTQPKQTAGALDIRNIIGGLIGAYGVILLLMGLFGDKELDKTGDINANLWAGVIMIVFAAAFLTWAWVRPTVVPDHVEAPKATERPPGH